MAIFSRIVLFIIVNILVVLSISMITSLLGLKPYLSSYGIDYQSLAIFCLLWGMCGSLISLFLSKFIAKWSYGVQIIPENTNDPSLARLIFTVHNLARKAGLSKMPEVGIYDSPELNAFATGPSKNSALVAVSTGLISRMNMAEVEGVLGHEITHITNGDMVTMTLLQGIVNAFVMFLSRVIAFAITVGRRDDNDRGPNFMYYIVQFILEIVFMILGSMVVAWFSRWREFRADAGGANLAGPEKMIAALKELQSTYELIGTSKEPALQTLQISSKPSGLMKLFASHPALSERIEKLQKLES